jgi:protein gp37
MARRPWRLIRDTPNLDWLLLTKRPQNIRKMLPAGWLTRGGWPNVWLGTTAENQEEYDRRWGALREIPALVRFISYEPALGPIDIKRTAFWPAATGEGRYAGALPNWIIASG